jgi:transcriptional regulator with XRE-family HTH domain
MDHSDVKVPFGKRIRELRKLRGWSQEELALRVDLDRSYVGGVERGERNISLENICLISAALGVPTSKLFEGWTAETPSPDPV